MTANFYVFIVTILTHMLRGISSAEDDRRHPGVMKEFCTAEFFNPRCFKNEVIVMKTATYGRMRIGRCITSEEVARQGKLIKIVDEDSVLLGCSKDVLEMLNEKCSGRPECEIKISDSVFGQVESCLPGLNAHLETDYDCITAADEERSCSVIASKTPIHIIQTFNRSKICGTKSQPWIIEAPIGQKIGFTLFDYSSSFIGTPQTQRFPDGCVKYGVIVEKAAKVNNSICRVDDAAGRKEIHFYTSQGNSASVYLTSSDEERTIDHGRRFILKVEAVGCSDIIPPEDMWLKRNEDEILIGCYSTRHSWRLSCKSGKWIGVLGNCSQGAVFEEHSIVTEPANNPGISKNAQVLAMVAICGFTVAICLIIICVGAICFKRFRTSSHRHDDNCCACYCRGNASFQRTKKSQIYTMKLKRNDYKTLSYSIGATSHRQIPDPGLTVHSTKEQINSSGLQSIPTYSVFVGDSERSDFIN